MSRRISAVEEVCSHVRVLWEKLSMYGRPGHALPDQQALQVVYERPEKLQPTLFRLASDTTDDEDTLAEIPQANDFLTQGVLLYKQVVDGRVNAGNAVPAAVGAIPAPRVFLNPEPCGKNCPLIDPETPSLLHQDLAALGINDVPTRNQVVIPNCCKDKKQLGAITLLWGRIQSLSVDQNLLDSLLAIAISRTTELHSTKNYPQGSTTRYQGLSRLVLGGWAIGFFHSLTEYTSGSHVFVPLESVKSSSLPPDSSSCMTGKGFRILLQFSQTGAPGYPDVQVLLLTMMSTATQPVWDVMFQVAVPKSKRVKLQPASSSQAPCIQSFDASSRDISDAVA